MIETTLATLDDQGSAYPTLPMPIYESGTDIVERAAEWARALMAVVDNEKSRMYAELGKNPNEPKKYLEVEAWQMVGMFAQAHAIAQEPTEVLDAEGRLVAYRCVAVLYQHDKIIGQGTMDCGLDSFPTRGKVGWDKNKAAMSTAQTWAISKAYRGRFGFIAKLAGYEATPADEMRQMEDKESAVLAPPKPANPKPKETKPKETKPEETKPKEPSEIPDQGGLGGCPLHGDVDWAVPHENQYGVITTSHPTEDGSRFCYYSHGYKDLFIATYQQMIGDGRQNDWLKDNFEGDTWSTLSPKNILAAMEMLTS
jgi:hypothetical protein